MITKIITIPKLVFLLALLIFSNQYKSVFAADIPKGWVNKNISQAVFAKSIKDRTPQDIIELNDNSLKKLYFFTNIRNLEGEIITHRWLYNDRVMAEVYLEVDGNRWRTWSSKNLWHKWTGIWTVQVVLENGNIILDKTFYYYPK